MRFFVISPLIISHIFWRTMTALCAKCAPNFRSEKPSKFCFSPHSFKGYSPEYSIIIILGCVGMIIAENYIVYSEQSGDIFRIRNKEAPLCPGCGSLLSGYDTRLRHCIGSDGLQKWFRLRRMKCPTCKRLHLEIPSFMEPSKHYESELIRRTVSGAGDDCPADDSTIRRWKNHPPGLPRK